MDLEAQNFRYPTKRDWQLEAEKQLKGKPLSALDQQTDEGISIKPIYFPADRPALGKINSAQNILIAQALFTENSTFNSNAKEALNNGQTALSINLDLTSQFAASASKVSAFPNLLHLTEYEHFEKLFDGIDLNNVPLLFDAYLKFDNISTYWKKYVAEKGFDPKKIKGSLGADPLSAALLYGGLPDDQDSIFEKLAITFKEMQDFSNLETITISADIIHNSGGHALHEHCYILGCIIFYVEQLAKYGISAGQVLSSIRVKFAVGNQQFNEIAKLRAMRLLWSNLCNGYEIEEFELKIDAVSSWHFLSEHDIHSNMLRSTSQVFSAIVGGCNSINILPFDLAVKKTDDASRRMARNTAIILLEEGSLGRVNDPSLGSGFIDSLTVELAQSAWKTFQDMEKKGGLFKNIKSGRFQSEIAGNAERQLNEFKAGRKKVIGVNFFKNENETVIDKWDKIQSHLTGFKSPSFAIDVQPLNISRLDEGYEE